MNDESSRVHEKQSILPKWSFSFSFIKKYKITNIALKISLIYLLSGALWVILSDRAVYMIAADKEMITFISMIKGWLYVFITGGLIFFLINSHLKKVINAEIKMKENYQELIKVHNKLVDSQEFNAVIIDEMINAFALHRIKLNEKGEPFDYEYIEINRSFESFTGLKRADVIGKSYKELVPKSDTETTDWIGIFGKVAITRVPVTFESHTKAFDKWVLVNVYSPKKYYFITVFQDISEIKRSEEQLRKSEKLFRLATEGSNDMIWDIDLINRKYFVSDRCYDLFGYKKVDIEFENIIEKLEDFIHPEDIEMAKELFIEHLEGNTPLYSCEFRIKCKNGNYKWCFCRGKALFDTEGEVIRIAGSITDVDGKKNNEIKLKASYSELEATYKELDLTQNKIRKQYAELLEYQEKLHKNAYYDSLTDLPNRLSLYENFSRELKEKTNTNKAFLFIDVDNFKLINDTLGHVVGDKLIIRIGERLKALFGRERVYRLGGDEFIVCCNDFARVERLEECAAKILESIRISFEIENSILHSTVSIGISVYPKDGESADELMRSADIAMYRAKALGKNKYVFYSDEMKEIVRERMLIEKHLRNALRNDEFLLYYQPQFDLERDEITGFEALIRWNNPELGFVSPDRFIGIAEETHLIISIGAWVLKTACVFINNLHKRGYSNLTISVNVSILQLMQENFVDTVMEVLDFTKLDPKYLELEITESILMESYQVIHSKLYNLKKLGVRVALDDFGRGYSSLSYLKQLPIDTLKIDKTFIDYITSEDKCDNITGMIVKIGREMKLNIIAEGVEDKHQMDYLKKHGCQKIQGYLISKPMASEKVIEFIAEF